CLDIVDELAEGHLPLLPDGRGVAQTARTDKDEALIDEVIPEIGPFPRPRCMEVSLWVNTGMHSADDDVTCATDKDLQLCIIEIDHMLLPGVHRDLLPGRTS